MPYIIGKEELNAIEHVLKRGNLDRYIDGEESVTSHFERDFSKEIGTHYSIALSSGTAALICGLAAMKIGPGDEVLIPSFTYIATALAVLAVGAIPIIVDIDETLTIDPTDIEQNITPQTKVIIPVHMHGLPCNMTKIMAIAKKHNLLVLEDVAQACGGSFQGEKLGAIGHAGCFSFNHYKILTCGEGGGLTTHDSELFQRAMIQHDGGCIYEAKSPELHVPIFAGGNYRISEIASAILRVQLTRLDYILTSLRKEKELLFQALQGISNQFQFCPTHDEKGDCSRALFLLFKEAKKAAQFIEAAKKKKLDVWSPMTPGHIFSDWEPVLKKRGAHHPKRDGFSVAKNPLKFSKKMCARSTNILNRTVGVGTKVGRSSKELTAFINEINYIVRKN